MIPRQRLLTVAVATTVLWGTFSHIRLSGQNQSAARPREASVRAASVPTQQALLDRFCLSCHNQKLKLGGLALDTMSLSAIGTGTDTWEKVVRKMRAGLMPPAGRPRPDAVAYDGFASWLESELDRAAAANPNPGRTEVFHRLNLAEYQNAIRDLLSLQMDVTSLLPADDASYGFDNMAGVLKVNESLMDRYVLAAQRISRAAVGAAPPSVVVDEFRLSDEQPQYERVEELPFGTRGGTVIHYNFPRDGTYTISTELRRVVEFTEPHELEVTVDGERVRLFTIQASRRRGSYDDGGENGDLEVRVPIKAGLRDVGVTFIEPPSTLFVKEGFRKRFQKPYIYDAAAVPIYEPFVEKVVIAGPFGPSQPGDTASRRAIFSCQPALRSDEARCTKTILARLSRRAYRRPVTDADLQPLLTFAADARAEEGFEAGVETGVRALLMSPQFLFRIEADPANVGPSTNYLISDLELASRLSFFLWSSIPDEPLLTVAAQGALRHPGVLEQQVRRMMADPRSKAFVRNFAGQWLQLRNVDAMRPFAANFPDFDEGLRQSFRRETELFVESIFREDRAAIELLTADYTFLNARLALHYGVPGIQGSHFRRVTYPDSRRRGLLGQGSILLVTSHATRTSPVLRGKWVLNNILGTPPPPPPPNVPPLAEKKGDAAGRPLSVRERMAQHRSNPACAACHSMIDPVGFALENFDAVGRWRDLDEYLNPVDASGTLPDGSRFDGLAQFRAGLVGNPTRIVRPLTEKLLTYALGRGLEPYDMPAVRAIAAGAALRDYRAQTLVVGIVKSQPFQMRRSPASPAHMSAARLEPSQ